MDASKQLAEKADNARLEEITGKLVDMIQSAQETSISDMRQIRHLGDSKADASEVAQLKQHIVSCRVRSVHLPCHVVGKAR